VNIITSGGNESDGMMNIIASQGNWNENRESVLTFPGKRHGAEETKIVSQGNGNFRTTNRGGRGRVNIVTFRRNGNKNREGALTFPGKRYETRGGCNNIPGECNNLRCHPMTRLKNAYSTLN
jgi:hypothetical protein